MMIQRRPPTRYSICWGKKESLIISSVASSYSSSPSSSCLLCCRRTQRSNPICRSRSCYSSYTTAKLDLPFSRHSRTGLIFGANTDIGKTVVSAGLVRAAIAAATQSPDHYCVKYIKPLQTGIVDGLGTDESFVRKYALSSMTKTASKGTNNISSTLHTRTLFHFPSPLSPHLASRRDHRPVSDTQVLEALYRELASSTPTSNSNDKSVSSVHQQQQQQTVNWIETAGGVLSPASSSPDNRHPSHASAALSQSSDSSSSSFPSSHASWGWMPQASLYQPLVGHVQTVLVGDGRIGGISCTLSAMESLLIRGYDIAAVIVIEDAAQNDPNSNNNNNYASTTTLDALREYVDHRPVFPLRCGNGERLQPRWISLPPLPAAEYSLHDWYHETATTNAFFQLNHYLDQMWQGSIEDQLTLAAEGSSVVWWPFTQHQTITADQDVTLVDSATGDSFSILHTNSNNVTVDASSSSTTSMRRRHVFDACASWWTQGLGHGETTLTVAAAAAAGRYGHVLFPQVVHAPAVALAQKLIVNGPGSGWAHRVFFSDNGSTAMEVAIKMGMKLYQSRTDVTETQLHSIDWAVAAQEGCYHGDTLGVMNVAEPSIFNEGQHPWYEPKGLILSTPTLGFVDGVLTLEMQEGLNPSFEVNTKFESMEKAMDVSSRMLTSLYSHYKEIFEMQCLVYEHSGVNRIIASVVLEPVLMGAGGMKLIDPLWQRAVMDIAKSRHIPVIFDEIFSGIYRLGVQSCREYLKADPDIACYAKLLTGGLLPMSVTLASAEVFDCFLGDTKSQALLHGHSYTAHPVGCVAAIHALDSLEEACNQSRMTGSQMTLFDVEQARALSRLPLVEKSIAIGSVLAVTIQSGDGVSGYGSSSQTIPIVKELLQKGIYARPLGNVIYLMATPLTSRDECTRLTNILHDVIESHGK